MNHYLDTSALLKGYLEEPGSETVRALLGASGGVITSVLAYTEARAGLARQERERRLTDAERRAALTDLERDWETWGCLDVTTPLAQEAGRLAEVHALSGADAVHLASALIVREESGGATTFWSSDIRLARAARREGLRIGNLGRAG